VNAPISVVVGYFASGSDRLNGHDAVRVEAGPHLLQPLVASNQQPGADQQHDGERHLADDERASRIRAARADGTAAGGANRSRDAAAAGAQRRHEAEQHAGADRDHDREGEHAQIDRHLREARNAGRAERHQRPRAPRGSDEAGGPAEQAEQGALGEELADQAGAARAERRPDGDLARARLRPRQQQVRHVDAGDQQHEADRAKQHEERLPDVAHHPLMQAARPPPSSRR
jgi:hypothetical protein